METAEEVLVKASGVVPLSSFDAAVEFGDKCVAVDLNLDRRAGLEDPQDSKCGEVFGKFVAQLGDG